MDWREKPRRPVSLNVMPDMFQVSVDHNLYLYHYTNVATAKDCILRPRTLKIGSFRNTNDPKESKNWEFSFALGGLDPSIEETTAARLAISNEIKDKAKVLCFSKDKNYLDTNPLNHIFSRGFAKPRMWAQYGSNHTGVCLVFNKKIIEKKIVEQFGNATNDIYQGSVSYVNRCIGENLYTSSYSINYPYYKKLGLLEYTRRHLLTHHPRLFFEKSVDWRDEDEYRWVIASALEGDLYVQFDNSLAGVVFGEYTDERDVSEIVNLAKAGGVQFEKMKWINCTPWLSFRKTWA